MFEKFLELFNQLNTTYQLYIEMGSNNIFALQLYYLLLFFLMAYIGRLLSKTGKFAPVVFLIVSISNLLFLPLNEVNSLFLTILYGAYIWGSGFKGRIFSKEIFFLAILLGIMQFFIVKAVYGSALSVLETGVEFTDLDRLIISLLSLIATALGYYLIHTFAKGSNKISDLALAFILFFYKGLITKYYLMLFYSLFQA